MARAKVSIALLIASLILLIIYGADAMVASSKPQSAGEQQGFLPLNSSVRGSAFGGGAVIMSIIGFVIARKEPSTPIAVLLFINGGLIIAGMLALIAQGALSSEKGSSVMTTVGSTIGMGIILVGLGVWKVIINKRIPATKNQQSKTS